MDRIITDFEKN
ncbi:hypothetical protein HYPGJ_20326 [Hyphomicrobium sp. GJ21]|nr:hypothetical protein HYPGJ_20326 [Hyphomicrobium sp. GJ21]